jgi:hypothetical protein
VLIVICLVIFIYLVIARLFAKKSCIPKSFHPKRVSKVFYVIDRNRSPLQHQSFRCRKEPNRQPIGKLMGADVVDRTT